MDNWVYEAVLKLIEHYRSEWWGNDYTPFEILVATILSQNTSDVNAQKAFSRLKEILGWITPERILSTPEDVLSDALKVAGLSRIKARRLKEISKILYDEYGGRFENLLQGDASIVRKRLLSLPGIGPKTADVILAFVKGVPIIPIDTHIFTISKRWGLTKGRQNYEEVRKILENLIPAEIRTKAHIALVEHGKRVCRARKPLCNLCPIEALCPYPKF